MARVVAYALIPALLAYPVASSPQPEPVDPGIVFLIMIKIGVRYGESLTNPRRRIFEPADTRRRSCTHVHNGHKTVLPHLSYVNLSFSQA